jgi:hypothetical protein
MAPPQPDLPGRSGLHWLFEIWRRELFSERIVPGSRRFLHRSLPAELDHQFAILGVP